MSYSNKELVSSTPVILIYPGKSETKPGAQISIINLKKFLSCCDYDLTCVGNV